MAGAAGKKAIEVPSLARKKMDARKKRRTKIKGKAAAAAAIVPKIVVEDYREVHADCSAGADSVWSFYDLFQFS